MLSLGTAYSAPYLPYLGPSIAYLEHLFPLEGPLLEPSGPYTP